MTRLRKMMLEELERRNYAQTTIDCYIQAIEDFARHFRRPPDQLTPGHSAAHTQTQELPRKAHDCRGRDCLHAHNHTRFREWRFVGDCCRFAQPCEMIAGAR